MDLELEWVRIEKVDDGYIVYHEGGEEWCDDLVEVNEVMEKVFLAP